MCMILLNYYAWILYNSNKIHVYRHDKYIEYIRQDQFIMLHVTYYMYLQNQPQGVQCRWNLSLGTECICIYCISLQAEALA